MNQIADLGYALLFDGDYGTGVIDFPPDFRQFGVRVVKVGTTSEQTSEYNK
jgi:hypothetical protein